MKKIIQNTLLGSDIQDILIDGTKISGIGAGLVSSHPEAQIIDGKDTAAFPSLINGHTHSPMTLLRGAGDDLGLHEWLTECMWPLEDKYTDEEFYWGNRMALMEMVRTGTGFFNEMYFNPHLALKALEETPLKARINFPIMDGMNPEVGKKQWKDCERFFEETTAPQGVQLGMVLHSVYTDSRESIEWVRNFAADKNLPIHIHLSETEKEVQDCMEAHEGLSPVEYLHQLGVLSQRVVAAHTVHLSETDIEILSDTGVNVVHNPGSNMKLASGVFPYKALRDKKIPILLGTDGAASNNNLDMLEEMKLAALLQKVHTGDPTLMSAEEIFEIATKKGAEIFNTGGGVIELGKEADIILMDLKSPALFPAWNLISSMVYSASGMDVKTHISSGNVLMEDYKIPGYERVLEEAGRCFDRLRS
ncbi:MULTISPECIES: amidohydrolase family protein [unclassified Oceanispirochaeta]|uniref:amidohydrolase family protein n=1 Tax=unclassified Oceanispirochaeta TaxID=2635722 RepID=UPI0013149C03|nr:MULTISPECIES: amidohydrolase [unclassified Oceanispirochaeta]MBF9017574.1 amidohydrolase [Oceanispirochaeta sp. M2]NPD74146.1 amidohydrolase [Oceanispirochaeta sp. M1]